MTKASSRTSWPWMQAWSDQGERILVRVESVEKVDRSTLAVDCTGSRLQNVRNRSVPDLTQDDNKRTTEEGPTTERI